LSLIKKKPEHRISNIDEEQPPVKTAKLEYNDSPSATEKIKFISTSSVNNSKTISTPGGPRAIYPIPQFVTPGDTSSQKSFVTNSDIQKRDNYSGGSKYVEYSSQIDDVIKQSVNIEVEKRKYPLESKCPKQTMDRIEKALTQRLFMISAKPASKDSIEHQYAVLGTVGKVYVVIIGIEPQCTCVDKARNYYYCKHILFVLLKSIKSSSRLSCFISTSIIIFRTKRDICKRII